MTVCDVFAQKGCRIVVHRRGPGPEDTQQLADDLLAVTTVFVASHHGKQAAENRRKRKCDPGSEAAKRRKVEGQKDVQEHAGDQAPSLSIEKST